MHASNHRRISLQVALFFSYLPRFFTAGLPRIHLSLSQYVDTSFDHFAVLNFVEFGVSRSSFVAVSTNFTFRRVCEQHETPTIVSEGP